MNFTAKLHLFNNALNSSTNLRRTTEDLYCLHLLNKVLHSGKFVPLTSMSLRPYMLTFLLNEMVINKRESIIELGAGVSTVLLARMAKMSNISPLIISVEQDIKWYKVVEGMLREEDLQDKVKLIHIPVEDRNFMGAKNHWYEQELLKNALKSYGSFDMLLIDGPTAYHDQIELSRYFALPFFKDYFSDNHVIFLDDASRKGEKQILQLWKKEFDKNFKIYAETLAVCYNGSHFESNPMKYVSI